MPGFTYHPAVNKHKDCVRFPFNGLVQEFQSFIRNNIGTHSEHKFGIMPDSVKNALLKKDIYVHYNGYFLMVYVEIGKEWGEDPDYTWERFDTKY